MSTNREDFQRKASLFAVLAALAAWFYAVAFVVLHNSLLSAIALMAGAAFASVVVVGLYDRFRIANPPVALLALLATSGGIFGMIAHGGYDLAASLHPPAGTPDAAALS